MKLLFFLCKGNYKLIFLCFLFADSSKHIIIKSPLFPDKSYTCKIVVLWKKSIITGENNYES
jgi:hypothetical protein